MNIPFVTAFRARKAKKSLKAKLTQLRHDLKFVETAKIEDLVKFFLLTTLFVDGLTPEEIRVMDDRCRRLVDRIGRGEWNRTPIGKQTQIQDVYVNPTGHFDEFYNCRSLIHIINNPGVKNDQCGFAKVPMDDKEFYWECFVKPFMKNNYSWIEKCIDETGD